MDNQIFKKLRVIPGQSASVLYAPEDYPFAQSELSFDKSSTQFDFVHLFVSSRQEFEERINEALSLCRNGGLLWVSYPKGSSKMKADINRDSLWDLAIPHGIHPVSQVSLDDTWSAVRFIGNKPDEIYAPPKKA